MAAVVFPSANERMNCMCKKGAFGASNAALLHRTYAVCGVHHRPGPFKEWTFATRPTNPTDSRSVFTCLSLGVFTEVGATTAKMMMMTTMCSMVATSKAKQSKAKQAVHRGYTKKREIMAELPNDRCNNRPGRELLRMKMMMMMMMMRKRRLKSRFKELFLIRIHNAHLFFSGRCDVWSGRSRWWRRWWWSRSGFFNSEWEDRPQLKSTWHHENDDDDIGAVFFTTCVRNFSFTVLNSASLYANNNVWTDIINTKSYILIRCMNQCACFQVGLILAHFLSKISKYRTNTVLIITIIH